MGERFFVRAVKHYADRIDDLLHAALNGHGAFVSATNPAKFAAGLRAARPVATQSCTARRAAS